MNPAIQPPEQILDQTTLTASIQPPQHSLAQATLTFNLSVAGMHRLSQDDFADGVGSSFDGSFDETF